MNQTTLLQSTERFLEKRFWRILLLVVIFALGTTLRLIHFGNSGIWRDEGLFLFVTEFGSVKNILTFLGNHESHPPLFYLVMSVWHACFGNSEQVSILLPILLGIAILPVGYYIASSSMGRTTGLAFMLLLALSPGMVDHTRLIRPYTFLFLLSLVSTHLLWRILTPGNRKPLLWGIYILTTCILVYTHNWCWVLVIAQGIAFGMAIIQHPGVDRRKMAFSFLSSQIIVLAIYCPWISTLLYQMAHTGHSPFERSQWFKTIYYYIEATIGIDPQFQVLYFIACLSVLVIGFQGKNRPIIPGPKQFPEAALAMRLHFTVALVAIAIAFALIPKANLLIPYCLLIVGPSLCLGFTGWLFYSPRTDIQQIICLVLLLITDASCYSKTSELRAHYKSNAHEVASIVTKNAQTGDLIIIAPEWLCCSINYYLKLTNPQIDYPQQHRMTAIEFDDREPKIRNVATWIKTKNRLAEFRKNKGTVWLLMLTDSQYAGANPNQDVVPATVDATPYRAHQIQSLLSAMYGRGEEFKTSADSHFLRERISVFRYSYNAPDGTALVGK